MPKFLPGDIVRRGDEIRRVEQFLASDETGGWDPVLMTNKGGESDPENWEVIEVREAFAVTGFPVPECDRLVYVGCNECDNYWWAWRGESEGGCFLDRGSCAWGGVNALKDGDDSYLDSPDLSRLPVRDCENQLPAIVRERLEAMLGGGA